MNHIKCIPAKLQGVMERSVEGFTTANLEKQVPSCLQMVTIKLFNYAALEKESVQL